MDKSHKDPQVIDLNVPRHAQYLHNAWKRHQDAVFWVDIDLAIKEGLTFHQTRSNAIILQGTLPAYCIPKVVRLKTGEVLHEKVYMSPRPPTNISLKHEWKRELSSEHAQRAEDGQLSRSFQSNQKTLNPIRERSGRPDITHDVINVPDSSQTRSAHESETFNVGDEILRKRTERSVADHDVSLESIMVNEADMDFRIPGLPHSVVKHAQSTSVRELIQKIENHPDRHVLQQDLRQNQAYNPVSPESKQMIQDVGNIELCELLETEPKTQCTVCLSYWNIGTLYCTCGQFLHKERGANQKFINYTMDLLSVPEYVIKKGRPHGHRYGKKAGRQIILYGQPIEQEIQKEGFSKESMTDSYEIKNSVFE